MSDGTYTIRAMARADLDRAIDWAAAEGWNPGLDDAGCFLATDRGGFLVGELDGIPITSISMVRYGAGYGFLGFYISVPEQRGRGFGYPIWEAGMALLGKRVIGLDGVPDQQPNYRKSGFVLAHRNVRYGGIVDAAPPSAEAGLLDLAELPAARILAYDRPFFPAPRDAFMRCWLRPEARAGLALVRDGAIAGYGVIRRCREGYKIGPLFADDTAGADALFRGLAAHAAGGPVYIDPPVTNAAAIALAKGHGLVPSFETARMYRGPAPDLPIARTFGITTFELG